jgi:chromosome segregation ATPase
MATIESVDDLIQQLRQHPEWRQALRRELLTEELLSLPQIVRELAAAQQRTEMRLEALTAQVDELAEAQKRTEARLEALAARVDELAEAQKRTEARLEALTARVDELAEAQKLTEQRLEALTVQVDRLAEAQQRTETRLAAVEGRLGTLDGRVFEQGYAARAVSCFDDLLRKSRLLDWSEVPDLLDQAAARISPEERKQVLAADLVLHGRRLDDQAETYLLAEVSVGIGLEDVHRAARRGRIFARATEQPVIPAVGGQEIIPEARELAGELEVSVFLDGGLRTD